MPPSKAGTQMPSDADENAIPERSADAPDRIILVPGFTSPRWVLYPLLRYLRMHISDTEAWDHPKVFRKLQVTIDSLASKLRSESEAGHRIALIGHSFGDWVARSALAVAGDARVIKLISISPVVTAVPLARLAHRLTGNLIPEIEVMADEEKASFALEVKPSIEHVVVWASWDLIVKRPDHWHTETTWHRTVKGNHITLVFQPNLWRLVADQLK